MSIIKNGVLSLGWKSIYLKSNCYLKTKNEFLIIVNRDLENSKEEEIAYHLSDIDNLMIDNLQSILSIQLINKLNEYGIYILVCDNKHDPTSMFLPLNLHHQPIKNLKAQFKIPKDIKGKLRQIIIRQKIINQRLVLEDFPVEKKALDWLITLEKRLAPHDPYNCEGQAAKHFFKYMYGYDFKRFSDDSINKALNFGYKILASAITRSIVSFGLHPSLGFFHSGERNYFNLTYDFIEPFRPLIDLIVGNNVYEYYNSFSINSKIELLKVLDALVVIDNKVHKVRNAIDIMTKSVVSIINDETYPIEKIKLPLIYKEGIKSEEDDEV